MFNKRLQTTGGRSYSDKRYSDKFFLSVHYNNRSPATFECPLVPSDFPKWGHLPSVPHAVGACVYIVLLSNWTVVTFDVVQWSFVANRHRDFSLNYHLASIALHHHIFVYSAVVTRNWPHGHTTGQRHTELLSDKHRLSGRWEREEEFCTHMKTNYIVNRKNVLQSYWPIQMHAFLQITVLQHVSWYE